MKSINLNRNESVEREDASELEPVVLSRCTEVTRGAPAFLNLDFDNIVWGMYFEF